jgi:hypothetical protein
MGRLFDSTEFRSLSLLSGGALHQIIVQDRQLAEPKLQIVEIQSLPTHGSTVRGSMFRVGVSDGHEYYFAVLSADMSEMIETHIESLNQQTPALTLRRTHDGFVSDTREWIPE